MKYKIDLFLLLERKKAFFFFKYQRLRGRIHKQREEFGKHLKRLKNEFDKQYCNCGKDMSEVGMD